MDGDLCPLPELIELKKRFGSYLLVDEAHSFGILGATGRGINQHFGLPADGVDVWTGSLSKAIPANGGFIAGSCALVYYLQHVAAPFWFSAALCPADAAAASAALAVIREEPHRLSGAHRNAEALRAGLQHLGYDTGASQTCIVPVILGDDEVAYRAARQLYAWGILVSAVVAPAVPRGAARLRAVDGQPCHGRTLRQGPGRDPRGLQEPAFPSGRGARVRVMEKAQRDIAGLSVQTRRRSQSLDSILGPRDISAGMASFALVRRRVSKTPTGRYVMLFDRVGLAAVACSSR